MSTAREFDRHFEADQLMETLEWPALPQLVARMLADEDRRRAVQDTGLLDGEADQAVDRLARLAAMALGAPRAAITLIELDRQVYAGRAGVAQHEDRIEHSYCKYAAAAGRPMMIRDAAADAVLRDHPATRAGVRCYLGVPLVTPHGHALGTVCVFGDEPRDWTTQDVEVLTEVSRAVMNELTMRQTLRRLTSAGADGASAAPPA